MRKLLLGTVAAVFSALPLVAQEVTPSAESRPAGKAEVSTWLVLAIGNGNEDGSLIALPMKSLDQCEEQGAVWITSKRIINNPERTRIGFECLEGK
jgi:hypothetical protein